MLFNRKVLEENHEIHHIIIYLPVVGTAKPHCIALLLLFSVVRTTTHFTILYVTYVLALRGRRGNFDELYFLFFFIIIIIFDHTIISYIQFSTTRHADYNERSRYIILLLCYALHITTIASWYLVYENWFSTLSL